MWLAKNIMDNHFRTRILPDIVFAMESQESKELSFCIVFKNRNFSALFVQIWAKLNFPQKLSSNTFQHPEKTNETILRKILNRRTNRWTGERTKTCMYNYRTYPMKPIGPITQGDEKLPSPFYSGTVAKVSVTSI